MRRRLRRLILITGTLISALLVVAFVASAFLFLKVGISGTAYVSILAGAVELRSLPVTLRAPLRPRTDVWPGGVRWFAGCIPHKVGLRDALVGNVRHNGFTLPLIYPFAAVAVPTMLVWRLGPKRVKPGRCRCGYDLTGNTSGRCPECGKGVA